MNKALHFHNVQNYCCQLSSTNHNFSQSCYLMIVRCGMIMNEAGRTDLPTLATESTQKDKRFTFMTQTPFLFLFFELQSRR